MDSNICFRSANGNYYLQDLQSNLLIYLRPEVARFSGLENIDFTNDKTRSYPAFLENDDTYYYKKFLFLKKYFLINGIEAKKENIVWGIGPEDVKKYFFSSPQITFEVTERCNLNCKYCAYGENYESFERRKNKDIKWAHAKLLIDYLVRDWSSNHRNSHNGTIAIGFYGGEPLLNFNFISKVVNYLNSLNLKNVRFAFNMTTNGTLLHKYFDYLKENDFSLLISLDGNEENNSYRVTKGGSNSFNKIFENCKKIMEKYPTYFETRVNFNSVLHNKNSVEEIYSFIKSEFNKTPQISSINMFGVNKDTAREFSKSYQDIQRSFEKASDLDLLQKELFVRLPAIHALLYYLLNRSGNLFKSINYLFIKDSNIRRVPTGTCLPFWKKTFITANGNILPCERIGNSIILGKIRNGKVNIDFEDISNRYCNYYDGLKPQCSECYNYRSCEKCFLQFEIKDGIPKCDNVISKEMLSNDFSSIITLMEDKPKLYSRIMKEVEID